MIHYSRTKKFYLFFLLFSTFLLFFKCSDDCRDDKAKINLLNQTINNLLFQIDSLKNNNHFVSLNKIIVDSVRVDTIAVSDLTGDKMIDGVLAFENGKRTRGRWAVPGYPHYAMFYFPHIVSIKKIRFNLFKGDQGYTNHIKFYNFSDLIYEGDVGDSLWNNIYLNFYGSSILLEVSGKSTNLNGHTNNWTDIGEIEFYGNK